MSNEKRKLYCFNEGTEREHSPKVVEDRGQRIRTYECDTCGESSNRNIKKR